MYIYIYIYIYYEASKYIIIIKLYKYILAQQNWVKAVLHKCLYIIVHRPRPFRRTALAGFFKMVILAVLDVI